MKKGPRSKLMRVDEEFFEVMKKKAEATGTSRIKLTKMLAKKTKKKKPKELVGFDFRI
jgi:DNA-binding transcriptional regulator GbsR (MarR family)